MATDIQVPISALEHYSYCARQCALIHVEQTFDDNVYTVRGLLSHERVDRGDASVERGVRAVRGIPLWSERLGLIGKADLVEMRAAGPYPVEYKVGPRVGQHAELQLCAQALCLEEMLQVSVPCGAVFHRANGKRKEVMFDQQLRNRTLEVLHEVRRMLTDLHMPPPRNDARCRNCSLVETCLPQVVGEPNRLRGIQGSLFVPATHADA